MCYTCEMMLRDEHSRESLLLAKKYPCPKCKVFCASGDVPPPPRRRTRKGPMRPLRPRRIKPCYHCFMKVDGHGTEECPLCKKARVQ